jgi:hypothetical protein
VTVEEKNKNKKTEIWRDWERKGEKRGRKGETKGVTDQ